MQRFLSLAAAALLPMSAAYLSGQADPIPARITYGDLSVKIENFLTAPFTDSGSTKTRISVMRPAYDGSGRTFINDLRGQFYVLNGVSLTTYADFNTVFPNFIDEPRLGTGFHSFTFHPDFKTNGKFYTSHTEAPGSGPADYGSPITETPIVQSVITEWTASDPSAAVFAGTRRELLRIDYARLVHNIQDLAFNPYLTSTDPDYGMLYICVGDGEAVNGGVPESGHRLDSLYGSIIRIDPLGNNSSNGKYGIPADNPFVGDGNAATLGEIYAWGFRNPHRIFWDSLHPERMFEVDIGEKSAEELNLIISGGDYGYSNREGTFVLNPTVSTTTVTPLPANDAEFGYVYPVAQYDHDEGAAIVGGVVYRGTKIPELWGKLIFGDISNGRVFYVDADSLTLGTQAEIKELRLIYNGSQKTLLQIMGDSRADLRFGTDAAGELYFTTKRDGKIRRIVTNIAVDNGDGDLINISTRARVSPNAAAMTAGFFIANRDRTVLIRGVGPTLSVLDVPEVLEDPVITLYDFETKEVIATNVRWGDASDPAAISAAASAVFAFGLGAGSEDAAMLINLPAGGYSVELTSASSGSGVALIEVYQVEPEPVAD